MGIKTYPLQMTDEQHQRYKEAAEELDITLKDLFFNAVEEKIKEENNDR